MKLYLMFILLVLSSLLTYKAQGASLGKGTFSTSDHEDIIKISSVKRSSENDQSLATTTEFSSGINRKLMTKITSSSTTTTISQNHKNDGNKHDPKPKVKATQGLVGKKETAMMSPENSKHWEKEVIAEQYPDVANIAEMDYTPARKKSPIHN